MMYTCAFACTAHEGCDDLRLIMRFRETSVQKCDRDLGTAQWSIHLSGGWRVRGRRGGGAGKGARGLGEGARRGADFFLCYLIAGHVGVGFV